MKPLLITAMMFFALMASSAFKAYDAETGDVLEIRAEGSFEEGSVVQIRDYGKGGAFREATIVRVGGAFYNLEIEIYDESRQETMVLEADVD